MNQLYKLPYNLFATAYGECNYNDANYNNETGTCTGGTSGGTNGGGLSDTGTMVLIFVTAAAIILLVAMLVRIWRRPAKQVK